MSTIIDSTCETSCFEMLLEEEVLIQVSCYYMINPLNTKRRQLYLKTQFVPRSKHFSSGL